MKALPRLLAGLVAALQAASLPALADSFTSMRLSELLGAEVTDPSGFAIGHVKELMLEPGSARLRYAVLELPRLGRGERQFAYPATVFAPSQAPGKVVLDLDRGQIERAEGFARSRWPSGGDEYWSRVERRFRGEPNGAPLAAAEASAPARTQAERQDADPAAGASAGQSANPDLVRATQLLGMNVTDRDAKDAGVVADMVVSLREARVRYLVLRPADSERTVNLPMDQAIRYSKRP